MARKSFALNKEPHVAEIGDDIELEFKPEVMGDDYLDAYEALQETYRELGIDPEDLAGVEPGKLRQAAAALRGFLAGFMLPASAEEFAGLRLPGRVLVALLEWVMEIYGGGRPPTSSTDSATSSPPPGTRGTGASRSKASTRTRGR